MKTETRELNGWTFTVITADEGKVFVRKHDGFRMGEEIILGFDYSTGTKREDKPEYYEEIEKPENEPS